MVHVMAGRVSHFGAKFHWVSAVEHEWGARHSFTMSKWAPHCRVKCGSSRCRFYHDDRPVNAFGLRRFGLKFVWPALVMSERWYSPIDSHVKLGLTVFYPSGDWTLLWLLWCATLRGKSILLPVGLWSSARWFARFAHFHGWFFFYEEAWNLFLSLLLLIQTMNGTHGPARSHSVNTSLAAVGFINEKPNTVNSGFNGTRPGTANRSLNRRCH